MSLLHNELIIDLGGNKLLLKQRCIEITEKPMMGIHKVSIKPEQESLVINYLHSGLLCHSKHTELFGDSGTLCCDGWGGILPNNRLIIPNYASPNIHHKVLL